LGSGREGGSTVPTPSRSSSECRIPPPLSAPAWPYQPPPNGCPVPGVPRAKETSANCGARASGSWGLLRIPKGINGHGFVNAPMAGSGICVPETIEEKTTSGGWQINDGCREQRSIKIFRSVDLLGGGGGEGMLPRQGFPFEPPGGGVRSLRTKRGAGNKAAG